jgi:heavy metal translocating P-type ATPase
MVRHRLSDLGRDRSRLVVVAVAVGAGGVLRLAGSDGAANLVWAATTAAILLTATLSLLRDLWRHRVGVDVVAVLALAGSLVVGEYLAGAVIALMLATGRALEARASARARRELEALLHRAPAFAHRVDSDSVVTVSVDAILPGDLLLVTLGEVVPTDGLVVGDAAVLDESALTGEAAVVERSAGEAVRSGGVNGGAAFRLRATAAAAESTYAGIIRLVREAEAARAPLTRLADRFALWFVPLTLAVAALAALLTQDLVRAVAVLVVATPCPLILAAPVALVGGMSRAARRGILIKNGAALEALGRAEIALFDKTGTLTEGRARLAAIETGGDMPAAECLRMGASLDQVSTHVLARPIVEAAREQGLELTMPEAAVEEPGQGIRGRVQGREVRVGRATYATGRRPTPTWAERLRRRSADEGLANVFVGIDGHLAAGLVLEDPLRPDARRLVQRLRRAGIRRTVMVTGDHPAVAQTIAAAAGVDAVHAECSPAGKLEVVAAERRRGTVMMAGDGINDAPALAAADVGVALGVRGATASSETADVVLMIDRIDRLGEAIEIARRSRRIALQSIVAGMALSFVAMGFAAFGALAPVYGAVVQELIDVAVILNALRAVGGNAHRLPPQEAVAASREALREHEEMRGGTAQLRRVADELGQVPPATARADLEEVRRFLRDELLPHELREERGLYPAVAAYSGGEEALVTAQREHTEVAKLAAALSRMVDDVEPTGPSPADLLVLRRVLYSLHAVLGLHRAGEEERLFEIVDGPGGVGDVKHARSG